jgi:exoribonuclease R
MCSLNPGVERLTVSVWCYVNEDGIISEKQRYGRSIINSQGRFTYEIVQDIINGKIKYGEVPQGYGMIRSVDEKAAFDSIMNLDKLARILRANRFREGAITIDTPKKKFELDNRLWPVNYSIEQRFEANFLVEEFMLLANVKVAQILVDNTREAAVLRRHPFPSEAKIKRFN